MHGHPGGSREWRRHAEPAAADGDRHTCHSTQLHRLHHTVWWETCRDSHRRLKSHSAHSLTHCVDMCVVVVFLAVSVYTNTWHLCPHVTIIAGVLALPETNGPQDNKTTLFHLHFSSCSLFTAFPLFCFLFLIWHFILCLPPTWTSWPAFLSLSVNACYLHLIIPSVFLPSLWHFPPLNVNTLL